MDTFEAYKLYLQVEQQLLGETNKTQAMPAYTALEELYKTTKLYGLERSRKWVHNRQADAEEKLLAALLETKEEAEWEALAFLERAHELYMNLLQLRLESKEATAELLKELEGRE